MIKSFQNASAEAAWQRRFIKGVPNDVMKVANRKLMQIHNARSLDDLENPTRQPAGAPFPEIAKDNIAFGSTISGGSAFFGEAVTPMMSKSSTTTKEI